MPLRFQVGKKVLCNLGSDGWRKGRIIAQKYREDEWPPNQYAPYQVFIDDDGMNAFIYVPEDSDRYCRDISNPIAPKRADALARHPEEKKTRASQQETSVAIGELVCSDGNEHDTNTVVDTSGCYRSGKCGCCNCCPRHWSAVELYSEHYRAVERNGLQVQHESVDLGTIQVGNVVEHPASQLCNKGFLQAPMLVRLPPGVLFSDDGSLQGKVVFDPHRPSTYSVKFVAVSTADWKNTGVVRLEINFQVKGNEIPAVFDSSAFLASEQAAFDQANAQLAKLENIWDEWEQGQLNGRETRDQMCQELDRLRNLLEAHPRLENGLFWAHLGGLHMNVHKLLENALFECELYLGHALTFDNDRVRMYVEANLDGCYQKRQLEAARFMWMDGAKLIMEEKWMEAAELLVKAAELKGGWGWAVNHGDIWTAEAAARLLHGTHQAIQNDNKVEIENVISEAQRLIAKAAKRSSESFPSGHPWVNDIAKEISSLRGIISKKDELVEWHAEFKSSTYTWCAMILNGSSIFPPKVSPRRADAITLTKRLPGHNNDISID